MTYNVEMYDNWGRLAYTRNGKIYFPKDGTKARIQTPTGSEVEGFIRHKPKQFRVSDHGKLDTGMTTQLVFVANLVGLEVEFPVEKVTFIE